MNNTQLALLLYSIKNKKELDCLLERGLEYSQIANLMLEVKKQELIVEEDEEFVLTGAGNDKLKSLMETIKNGEKNFWIKPAEEYRTEKIRISDIYLPKRTKWRNKPR